MNRKKAELNRRVQLDPQSISAKIRNICSEARVYGYSKYFELLQSGLLWNHVSEKLQDHVIELVAKFLGSDFCWVCTEVYQCGGFVNRIGTLKHLSSGILFNCIPGGAFRMGGAPYYEQFSKNDTTIKPFLLGKYPVFQREWDQFEGVDKRLFFGSELPIERIVIPSVQKWLSRVDSRMRLPSEAEWEYACRSNSTAIFPWGDLMDRDRVWFDENSSGMTHQPYEHDLFPNAFGLVDCLGNVSELCEGDFYEDLGHAPKTQEPLRIDGSEEWTCKGGAYSYYESLCAPSSKVAIHRGIKDTVTGLGLRVCISIV